MANADDSGTRSCVPESSAVCYLFIGRFRDQKMRKPLCRQVLACRVIRSIDQAPTKFCAVPRRARI